MPRLEMHKRKVPQKLIVFGLFCSIFIVLISIVLLVKLAPSNEKIAFTSIDHPIIYDGELYDKPALIRGDNVYLPLSFVKEVIDPSLQYDEKTTSFIITTKSKVIQLKNTRLENLINSKVVNLEVPAFIKNSAEVYLSYEPVKSLYPFSVRLLGKNGFVSVEKDGSTQTFGEIIGGKQYKLRLRKNPTYTSPYVATVKKSEQVIIEKENEDFYFVRKENGVAGFLNKDSVKLKGSSIVKVNYEDEKQAAPPLKWPVNLTWEAVYTKTPDPKNLPDMPGLNVVSPTWFKIKNDKGDISNLGSVAYSNWAHQNGLHVWGLFSNDFEPKKTHAVLKDFETRKKMIIQLLQYANMYKLDGINLDFENVNLEDGPLLTQFASEITPYFHEAGLTVSMDITFLSTSENWSQFYEREKLAKIVDYLIVMAYDEHWANSPKAGSVASLPWVEENLQKLLEQVPSERLILGIPFYTRIWEEKKTEKGQVEVSSQALSMEQVNELIKEKNLKPQFDGESGQNYVEFKENESTFKIWLEDSNSIQSRIDLFHMYKLAGIASWNRHFANQGVWATISESLNNITVKK